MISIVIPAYNEKKRLPDTLDAVHNFFTGKTYEIIVVDDGSTDGTDSVVTKDKLLKLPVNTGKGNAVKTGVLAAVGERILIMDADLATPIKEIEKLLESGADLAIGSRALPKSKVHGRIKIRSMAGKLFPFIVRILTGLTYRDTQCGFKLFTRRSAHIIFSRLITRGYAFDVEVLVMAREFGFTVEEIPVEWYERSGSKVNLFRDSYRMVNEILRMNQERSDTIGDIRPAESRVI